ncbi:unnamed protein product [Cylicocyclus nassatus]|uniref:Teneurin-like YD-shell domain-containing protein n=1 Tax=Cylicocyclus nassatus TaxID=53992 RepID=A0AA36LZV5_CYLNA|nr:unnamed protein product [Cylicocyclus nassatus]
MPQIRLANARIKQNIGFMSNTPSRIIYMDDGFSVTHAGMISLLDSQTHPAHGETSILKMKTTIDAIQNPTRRALTSRFDWRPFLKRGGAERRIAEIGARPRMNGVSAFTVTFDRVTRSDVISAKSEHETLRLSYTDNGELESIAQEGVMDLEPAYRLANLSIHHDSLGKRNELIWGNRTTQVTYDRQNRIVERTVKGGVTAKFMYTKELRHPSTVELPVGLKYSLKFDSRGRLREITTPAAETHHFSATPFGSGLVIKRRIPFTKKAFVAAEDSDGKLLEWVTADEQHHVLREYDQYGRVVREMYDGSTTKYVYQADHAVAVTSPEHTTVQPCKKFKPKSPGEARKNSIATAHLEPPPNGACYVGRLPDEIVDPPILISSSVQVIGASSQCPINKAVVVEQRNDTTVTLVEGSTGACIGYLTLRFNPDKAPSAVPHLQHYALQVTEEASPVIDRCHINSTSSVGAAVCVKRTAAKPKVRHRTITDCENVGQHTHNNPSNIFDNIHFNVLSGIMIVVFVILLSTPAVAQAVDRDFKFFRERRENASSMR